MNEPSKRTCGPPSGLGSRGSFCDGRDIGTVGMMTMGSLGAPRRSSAGADADAEAYVAPLYQDCHSLPEWIILFSNNVAETAILSPVCSSLCPTAQPDDIVCYNQRLSWPRIGASLYSAGQVPCINCQVHLGIIIGNRQLMPAARYLQSIKSSFQSATF